MPRILFGSLPLRLMMPTDRVAAAAQGVKELVFRTLPSANKVSTCCAVLCVRALCVGLPSDTSPQRPQDRDQAHAGAPVRPAGGEREHREL